MKVLVAEDHEHSCDVLVRRLRRLGCEVFPATNTVELRELAKAEPFDVVLLCFSPRENNGWKAAEEIIGHNGAPVIAISSVPFHSDRASAMANGCKGYLPKPFEFRELLQEIGKVTGVEISSTKDA